MRDVLPVGNGHVPAAVAPRSPLLTTRNRRLSLRSAALLCLVAASAVSAEPSDTSDQALTMPAATIPQVSPALPASPAPVQRDRTPTTPVLSARDSGAGLELEVANFANAHGCPVTTRIRINPNSSNAAVARAAAEAAIATDAPIRTTISRCDTDGTPMTDSVWISNNGGGFGPISRSFF